MNSALAVRLRGAMSETSLQRLRELLDLEGSGSPADAGDTDFGHRYLDDFHTVILRLSRQDADVWALELTYLVQPPTAQTVEGVLAGIRTAVGEIGGFALEEEPVEGTADAADAAPPPGSGPVSLEQATAIAAEWVNAGRPPEGQV